VWSGCTDIPEGDGSLEQMYGVVAVIYLMYLRRVAASRDLEWLY
jgi:hypothetical protein